MRLTMLGLGLSLTVAPSAMAQQAAAPARPAAAPQPATPDDEGEGEIVVTGQREVGSVPGDIPPEIQLRPADIRAYGVSSIADLLTELAPQTRSGRGGQPVVLLNGRRISSFAEIRDLPTEAILRVDILPEEAALKLGYSADQRVVNFVLRQRFRSTTIEAGDALATAGGRNSPRATLGLVNIRPNGRFNLNLDYQSSSALLESERDIVGLSSSLFDVTGNVVPVAGGAQVDPALSLLAGTTVTVAGVPASAAAGRPTLAAFAAAANRANVTDQTRYRTLLPDTQTFAANAVLARTVFGNVAASINGRVEATRSESLQGLPGVALTLPAGNPFSPFAGTVVVDRALDRFDPLRQTNDSIASHAGASLNGTAGKYRWTVTANYDRTDTKSISEVGVDATAFQARLLANDATANPFAALGPDQLGIAAASRGRSTAIAAGIDALLNGSPFSLPAGSVSTSLRVGARTTDFDSRSFRAGLTQTGQVSRDIVNGQLNVDVPITSRRTGFLDAIGNLSANINLALDDLSDFGTLTTLGYGANWSPIEPVRILVSFTDQDDAPTAQQLGNPVIVTPNARLFDYVRGLSVDVTRLTGGNPGLIADNRHVFTAEASAKPLSKSDLTLTATYTRIRTEDAIADFPVATAAVETAFPDRFTRDGSGALLRVDARPVNYDSVDTSEIRWGFNFSKSIKSKLQKQIEAFRAGTGPNPFAGFRRPGATPGQEAAPRPGERASPTEGQGTPPPGAPGTAPPPEGGAPGGGPPPGGGGFGGFGGFRGGPGGGGRGGFGGFGGGGGAAQAGGRLQFALYHTWHLQDRVTIRDGLPVLDLLGGSAIGNNGGQSRHEIEGQAGYSNNGIGVRLSANYASGTTVRGGTAAVANTLDFSRLTTLDLRLFADLTQRLDFIRKHRWAVGMRVTLGVTNLLDTRQRVTDQSGTVPVSYQGDYIDPLGRTVRLSIRKLFFRRSAR